MVETIKTPRNFIKAIDTIEFVSLPETVNYVDVPLFPLSSGARQITNRFTINNTTKTQTVEYTINQTILRSFRIFCNITSLPPIEPLTPEITDSDLSFAIKATEQEMLNPGYLFELILQNGLSRSSISNYRLQNRRPGYYINLMMFLSGQDEFIGDTDTQFIARIRDIGSGFPTPTDQIVVYAEMEEVGVIYPFFSGSENLKVELSGSIAGIGNPTNNGSLKLFVYDAIPQNLTVYFSGSQPDFPADLGGFVKTTFSSVPSATEISLSSFFNQNGAGFYFLGFTNPSTSDHFWSIPLIETVVNPPGGAQAFSASCSDSTQNLTSAATITMLQITDPNCNITLNYQVPN